MKIFKLIYFVLLTGLVSQLSYAEGLKALNADLVFDSTSFGINNAILENKISETSNYDKLNNYFINGSLPTELEVSGWWSGRCYTRISQNEPVGMILLALTIINSPASDDNGGPLFPPSEPTRKFNLALANESQFSDEPDRYDNLSYSDRENIQIFIDSEFRNKMFTSTIFEESLSSRSIGLRYLVRKYQNYFITRVTRIEGDTSGKTGEVFANCYFFKKIN